MAAQAPQNLTTDFVKSRLLNVAQTSFYALTLPIPSAIQGLMRSRGLKIAGTANDLSQVELLCTEASLPGSTIATHDVTNDYAGVTEKMAYRRIYDQGLNLTFYVDRDYHAIEIFETWVDYITGGEDRGLSKSRHRNFRMRYPDSYKQEIYITKFEKDQHSSLSDRRKNVMNYSFIGAFPQTITSMPVSYNQPDILRCNVSFSYIRYVAERSLRGARGARSNTMRTIPNISSINNSNIPVNSSTTAQIAKDNAQYGNTFPAGSFSISPTQNKNANKVLQDDFLPYIK